MRFMEALTKLVIGMSRFGDHLLKQKFIGIVVASIAFACGAGLAHALKGEPRQACAAVEVKTADPARAEVGMSDTRADEAVEEGAVFEGRYVNHTYGYSVTIPDGFIGLGATPPAPQQGFGIDLDNPRSTRWGRGPEFPKSYVYVDASYSTLKRWQLDDAVNAKLRFLLEKVGDASVLSRTPPRLGDLHTTRVLLRYEEGGEEMVSDKVVAFSDEGVETVLYTFGLRTPRSKYERDRPVFEALLKSWCLQPAE